MEEDASRSSCVAFLLARERGKAAREIDWGELDASATPAPAILYASRLDFRDSVRDAAGDEVLLAYPSHGVPYVVAMKWMASCADDGSQAGAGAVKPCVTRPEQRIQVSLGLFRIVIVTLPFSSMSGSGGTGEEGRRLCQMNNSPAMRREGTKASPDPRVSHAGRPLDHLMTSRVAQWV